MLGLEVRRLFHRHGPAAEIIGRENLFLGKPQGVQHVETGVIELGVGEPEGVSAKILPQSPFVEGKSNFEDLIQRRFQAVDDLRG